MAVIRLSSYDARIFRQMFPRLFEVVSQICENERWNLFLAVHRIWDTYYPLGEAEDLAKDLGDLLVALGFFREAIIYYDKSLMIYGKTPETLYKIAVCYCLMSDFVTAAPIIQELLAFEPENQHLQQLIEQFKTELAI